MALFGYPVAQENDAERAVRAALAIQRALAELNRKNEGSSKPALAARIAIDSGPVVVDAAAEIYGDVPMPRSRFSPLRRSPCRGSERRAAAVARLAARAPPAAKRQLRRRAA
jgi:hypothetical protein